MRSDFLREDFKPEDPVRKTASATQARRLARILNDIQGVGCRIEKPRLDDGYGWRVVIDGTSDIPLPGGVNSPFETDTDKYAVTKSPNGRQTIQHNPEDYTGDTDSHANEVQLHNVQHVKEGSSSIPFFVSVTPLQGAGDGKVSGELYWAQVDSSRHRAEYGVYGAEYRSLSLTNDYSDTTHGQWNFGLYGFVGSASCSVPYSDHTGTSKELAWRVPVAVGGNPYAIPSDYTLTFVTGGVSSYLGTTATVVLKTRTAVVTNGTINFSDSESTASSFQAAVYLDPGDVNYAAKHDSLSDTAASALHDYRFLHRAGRSTDKYQYPGVNQCESIANDTSGKYGIVFSTGQLNDAGGAVSVDYSGCGLYYSGTKTLDWYGKHLHGKWSIGYNQSGPPYDGACVAVDGVTHAFEVLGSTYHHIRAYDDSGPRTEVRGLRLYARDSTSVYFDLEVSDGVLVVRDHTGVNCGEFRRSL